MDGVAIGEGWDAYCARAAGGHLLRMAATLWERAGTKGETGRHGLDETVHRLRKAAVEVTMREADFLDVLAAVNVSVDDARTILAEVKRRARTLRGQLDLFPEAL